MSVKPLHANAETIESTLTSLLSIVVDNVVRGMWAWTGRGYGVESLQPDALKPITAARARACNRNRTKTKE